ncbi:acetyl esterase [Astrocystis sublimbata]|nr:acetyl esterase [Astrocystis sublimbata]
MTLTSDLAIDYERFNPDNAAEETKKHCDELEKVMRAAPTWWDLGAPRYREMMESGDAGRRKPTRLPNAYDIQIPSREPGRDIPVRVYKPDDKAPSRGIILHAHGGGWKLLFLAGESGGAHMAVLAALELIRSRPQHELRGLVLPYGNYTLDLGLPSMVGFSKPIPIDQETCTHFTEAYTPGWTVEARRNPLASPLYEDLRGLAASTPSGKLPPALFLCGTNDPLFDDSLLFAVKWMTAGSEAVLKVFPGAPHLFNTRELEVARESFKYEAEFLLGKMQDVVY